MYSRDREFQKQSPIAVTNRTIERDLESSSWALHRIANGLQNGLINKALILGLLLLVAESLLISHFQPGVALAILRDTPPLAILTGTLANVTPLLIPVVGTAVCAFGIVELGGEHSRYGMNQLMLGFAILLAALVFIDRSLVSMWLLLPLLAAAALAIVFGIWERSRSSYDDGQIEFLRSFLKIFVTLFVAGFVLVNPAVRDNLQRPYLPAEEIVLKEGRAETPVVGYVLSTGGGTNWTTVLSESDRSVQILNTDSISHRAICTLDGSSSSRPWWDWFTTEKDGNIPHCDA